MDADIGVQVHGVPELRHEPPARVIEGGAPGGHVQRRSLRCRLPQRAQSGGGLDGSAAFTDNGHLEEVADAALQALEGQLGALGIPGAARKGCNSACAGPLWAAATLARCGGSSSSSAAWAGVLVRVSVVWGIIGHPAACGHGGHLAGAGLWAHAGDGPRRVVEGGRGGAAACGWRHRGCPRGRSSGNRSAAGTPSCTASCDWASHAKMAPASLAAAPRDAASALLAAAPRAAASAAAPGASGARTAFLKPAARGGRLLPDRQEFARVRAVAARLLSWRSWRRQLPGVRAQRDPSAVGLGPGREEINAVVGARAADGRVDLERSSSECGGDGRAAFAARACIRRVVIEAGPSGSDHGQCVGNAEQNFVAD